MSHASVLVITDTRPSEAKLQEILLPWHEYECTGIERYLEWVDHTDEFTKEFNETERAYVRLHDGELVDAYDDRFYREVEPTKANNYRSYETLPVPPGAVEVQMTRAAAGENLFEAADREGYAAIPDQPGRFGRRTNPNRKWDWWQIGGRYGGRLMPRNLVPAYRNEDSRTGGKWGPDHGHGRDGYDQIRWGDLDLEGMLAEERRKKAEEWDGAEAKYREKATDDVSFGSVLRNYDDLLAALRADTRSGQALYQRIEADPEATRLRKLVGHANDMFGDYSISGAYTREAHVATAAGLSAFAVVKDGRWAERGQLGWWGSVADEKGDWPAQLDAILATIRPDQWVTVVDYHI
jgi:hypothetical protein